MSDMIVVSHGNKMFEITNIIHVPRLGEVVFYNNNRYTVVDVTYDYDEKNIYVFTEMK